MYGRPEFTARYLIESAETLERAAEIVAGEQSSGTFLAVPGETEALKERSRARVVGIERLDPVPAPSLVSAQNERRGVAGPYERGIVEIAFPIGNVGPNLPNLLATVAGNLFELGEITGARLLGLDLPEYYAARFPGPQFGVSGTRTAAGVDGRPLLGTIIKPSIGLSPEDTAALVDALCAADLDFIKDDELNGDAPSAPFAERLGAVMPVIERHADRLGRKPMYAINISGSVEQMRRNYDLYQVSLIRTHPFGRSSCVPWVPPGS